MLEIHDAYLCDQCEARFSTFNRLRAHVFKKHRVSNVAQRFAITSRCRACLRQYEGRQQLLHHLKYFRTGCLLKLIASVLPLTDEQLEGIQQNQHDQLQIQRNAQRKNRRRSPVIRSQGPLLP